MKCPEYKTFTVQVTLPIPVQAVDELHAIKQAYNSISIVTKPYQGFTLIDPKKWDFTILSDQA